MEVEPSSVTLIPPPLSAREKLLLEHMRTRSPEAPADWPSYISSTEESIELAGVYRRRYQLLNLVDAHYPQWLPRNLTVPGMYSWRKVFAGRVLHYRLTCCIKRARSAGTLQERGVRLAAVADGLLDVEPCYRNVVHGVLSIYPHLYRLMVSAKTRAADRAWSTSVYPKYSFLADCVLEEAVEAKDIELVCQLIPMMSCKAFPSSCAPKVFDALDSERLVSAVRDNLVQVSYADALSNHRRREVRRLSDPTVQPLSPSFYKMVLTKRVAVMCYNGYNAHHEVMRALDTLVEMHRDGRVSRSELDRARDRIFALASRGPYPSYAYLLEGSQRLVSERFAAAVVPFAMAAAASTKK